MILRVCDLADSVLQHFVVATDDERIGEEVLSAGYRAVMTQRSHINGTSRCLEAFRKMTEEGARFSGFVNLQGDEPLLDPSGIALMAASILDHNERIVTLVHRSHDPSWYFNPNRVKVVCNVLGDAIYFSRAPIPHYRDQEQFATKGCLIHAGIYGFPAKLAEQIEKLDPAEAEINESLEQLRWLDHGIRVHCIAVKRHYPGIDTPEDLEAIQGNF